MNYLDYIVVAAYLIGILTLGFMLKMEHSKEGFFLGDKSFGWLPLSLSTMATQLSTVSFISAPAFVALKPGGGLQWLTNEMAVPIAMLFLMAVIMPVLFKAGVVSIYEFLERRLGASTRMLLSIVFQLTRGFATGIMVYSLAIILESVTGIEYWQTIIVIGLVTIIYSSQGGMKAVVWGDVIQMAIIFFGLIICVVYALDNMGGWDNFVSHIDKPRLTVIELDKFGFNGDQFGFWPMLLGGFFLYVSYYGCDQTQAQRLLSSGSEKTLRTILLANGLFRFPVVLLYCFLGVVFGAFLSHNPDFLAKIPSHQPDKMMPIFIRDYLPHGIMGLIIVALSSAAMSSLSSVINSLTAVTMEDIIGKVKHLANDDHYMRVSQATSVCWGAAILALSFVAGNIADTVIEAINKVGSTSYGPIFALFTLAIFSRRPTAMGANIGLLTGVLFNFYLWLHQPQIFWMWWNLIGFVVTISVAYLISALTKPQQAPMDFDLKSAIALSQNWSFYITLIVYTGFIIGLSFAIPHLF